MGLKLYNIQLADHRTGKIIQDSGGVCFVATAGSPQKATLYTEAGATQANPVSLTNGKIAFATADTVSSVDLYIQGPNGHFVVVKGVEASGPNEIFIDQGQRTGAMVIPFSFDDQAGDATETDTGFVEPASAMILPHPAILVTGTDATETIDFGTDSTDSGDADGFGDGLSIATAGLVKGTILNGGNTLGALFEVQDSANAGDLTHEARVSGGKAITYTLSAGADTGEGFLILPYVLGGSF